MSYTKDWASDKKIDFINEAFKYLKFFPKSGSDGPLGIDFIIFLQLEDTVNELLELDSQERRKK